MEHMQQQQPQQQQQQHQDGTGGRTSNMASVQETAINSQEEAMIRFSPSSPFVTMRHYISEFDPNESVTNMTMNALKLAESWKAYIDTFVDLCDVDKVPIENRRKLLLLLAGSKLRRLLCQLETASETQTATLEETVRLLTQHFENRRSIQMARFNFFYGPQNRRRIGESLNEWTSRLITLTEKCQFSKDIADGMTVNDALTVVMYKQSHEEMSVKQKDGKKNGATPIKKGETGSEGEEDEEQPMPVELQWGEGDDGQQQQQQQHPVMKVESGEVVQQHHQQQQQQGGGGVVQLNSFIYASRPPQAAMQQLPRLPTEPSFPPGVNNQNLSNLSHSDMDLLRRARGGPCICPNCTLFPKRRAGKHNCHIPGCGREYSKTSHLRAHLVSHCNVLPFACSWVGCNKRFYRTDQLTRHARIHTGEKKFTCGVCDHAFSRSDHLAKHVRRHTNVNAAGANAAGTNGGPPPNANNNGANNNSNNNSRNIAPGNNAVQGGPTNNSSVGQAQTANNLLAGNTSNNLAAAVAAAANHQQHMLGMPPLPYMQMPHKNPPHFLYH